MKSKTIKLLPFIFILPSLLFAFDPGPRFDRDLTFDNQYNVVTNLKIQKLYGTISMHTLSYSLAYRFDNSFIFGFSLISPSFGIRGSDIDGSWMLTFPSLAYSLYTVYEFSNTKNPSFSCRGKNRILV